MKTKFAAASAALYPAFSPKESFWPAFIYFLNHGWTRMNLTRLTPQPPERDLQVASAWLFRQLELFQSAAYTTLKRHNCIAEAKSPFSHPCSSVFIRGWIHFVTVKMTFIKSASREELPTMISNWPGSTMYFRLTS